MAKDIFKKEEISRKEQQKNLEKLQQQELKEYYKNLYKTSEDFRNSSTDLANKIKEFNDAYNLYLEELSLALEKYTGESYNKEEVLEKAVEIFKKSGKEEILELELVDFLEAIKNLPPIVRETLGFFSVSGTFIDANLPPAKSNINSISNRIKLSLYEERVLNGLLYLLALNSDRNIKSDKYYLGNGEAKIKVNRNSTLIQPNLNINLNDLCREILNKKRISGRDKIEVNEAIENLCSKKINYTKKVKGGNFNFTGSLITKWGEGELLNKPIISIGFNPIFISDLKTKFIKRKRTLFRELDKASPKRLKNSTYFLVKYIERAMSNKNYTQQIYKENLLEVLDIKNERKARREDKLKEALEVCMKINLLEKYSIEKASKGDKFILNINPNYLS